MASTRGEGKSGEAPPARLRPVELAHDVRRGAVVGHRVVERLRVVPDDDVARVPGVEVRERGARRVREDHGQQVPARLLRFQALDDHVRAADVEHRPAVERVGLDELVRGVREFCEVLLITGAAKSAISRTDATMLALSAPVFDQ